ncbi:DNA-processing protein DprA [Clostridium perfringens]|uniref:DNA-processing protein DprA n=1 Tax=Clostridium perfringens TaxID=1502 RepID=UPI0018E4A9F0|nr:DNA-processing protein DprA [Clostridium perfringens]MBI6041850.1 DNA-processing protein DprA [Clostridium perfringens]MBI6075113.1 DNA-processing protein DprA [Clostridium perfringens]MDK0814011.1 DNA-processing protein DprA [Clostridium perfringens]HAT4141159.1 transporter [Clostridium perfringens]
MKYSDITLKVLAAKECGIIKSNAQFWNDFDEIEKFEMAISKDSNFDNTIIKLRNELISSDNYEEGIISVYDESFPVINKKVKNKGDKPYLLFYKGNLELLDDLNNNIAVIGLIDPDKNIAKRESDVVEKLIDNDLVIVSGLAAGCDSIAHKLCLEMGGKTIAVLPSQLNKIYPAENKKLAEDIVQKGGLLISEYYKEPKTKFEAVNRFIQRDRLQAMFSKAIILVASYRKGEGDSGSRHAMDAARKYEIDRYVIYNNKTDENNSMFALNKDLLLDKKINSVKVLKSSSINEIKSLKNNDLISDNSYKSEQLKLL